MAKTSKSSNVPPIAKKVSHVTKLHGVTLKDDYFWLREKENPEVISYLEAENAHTNQWLAKHTKLEGDLFNDIVSRVREDDESAPYQDGNYMYGMQIKKGQQYPSNFRYPVGKAKLRKVYFDSNIEAKGTEFFSIGGMEISPDEMQLAYSKDTTGFRQYQLFVRDLKTGKDSAMIAEKVGSFAWAADNKTILYTIEDKAKRQYKVLKHVLGTDTHAEIYEEKDERFRVGVGETKSKDMIAIVSGSHTTTEQRFAPSDLSKPFKIILPRKKDVEYDDEYRKGEFYILHNFETPAFKISKIKLADVGKWKNLKNFMKPTKGALFSSFELFEKFMVISERANGLEQLMVHSFGKKTTKHIKFPESSYSLTAGHNHVFTSTKYRFGYSSMISPMSAFYADLNSLELELIKENTPPNYDKKLYKTERVFTTARDGTKVPVSLVYRIDKFKPGQNASLISAYGSYGITSDADFDAGIFSLLDRGLVAATVNIRGGGEFGKPWHDAGKMRKKMNTFTDFIDAIKELKATKYISDDGVFIEGGSAGGLLMGAVVNLKPQMFCGVLAIVPFVDIINTMLDETMPLTVGEFEEWGNPKKKKEFEYMYKYSPYDNLKKGAYPAMWIRTSLHDSQVMYWEPAKYTAKLRTLKTNDNTPLLFLIDMKSGHGGASGRYDGYREIARDYAFILANLPSS